MLVIVKLRFFFFSTFLLFFFFVFLSETGIAQGQEKISQECESILERDAISLAKKKKLKLDPCSDKCKEITKEKDLQNTPFEKLLHEVCRNYRSKQGILSNLEPLLIISSIPLMSDSEVIRNMDDINRYTCSQLQNHSRYEDYMDEYRHYVTLAGATFGVPSQFLSCLILQESKWDPDVKSESNAKGVGQFVKTTVDFIDNIIKSEYEIDTSKYKKIREEHRPMTGDDYIAYLDSEVQRKDLRYLSNLEEGAYLKKLWIEYFTYLVCKGKKFEIPTRFQMGVKGYQYVSNAVGASALYVRFIINEIIDSIENLKLAGEVDLKTLARTQKLLKNSIAEAGESKAYMDYVNKRDKLSEVIAERKRLLYENSQEYDKVAFEYARNNYKGFSDKEKIEYSINDLQEEIRQFVLELESHTKELPNNITKEEREFLANEKKIELIERELEVIENIYDIFHSMSFNRFSDKAIDFLVIIAAFYNHGPHGAIELIIENGGLDMTGSLLKNWINILREKIDNDSRRNEIQTHMSAVRKCLDAKEPFNNWGGRCSE